MKIRVVLDTTNRKIFQNYSPLFRLQESNETDKQKFVTASLFRSNVEKSCHNPIESNYSAGDQVLGNYNSSF